MLTVLWFDNFVTLLTTIPGKWWKHKQNLWKGWKKCLSEPLFLSKLLFVYSPSKEFPWKCLQADPETQPCGLWGLVRTDWKKQSSSERELNPIRLLFCAHCASLVDRLTIISCSCSVRKYETNQCQVYAETLMMVYILYIYVAIKYPITFDHAGAVWCIPFSLPNIWRGDYMCIVHTEFILWFLISKTTFPDVECKTRSAGEGFVKVNKGGWDWWSCSQQERATTSWPGDQQESGDLGPAFQKQEVASSVQLI